MLLPEATRKTESPLGKRLFRGKTETKIDWKNEGGYLITLISSKIKIQLKWAYKKLQRASTNVNNLVTVKDSAGTYPIFRELPTDIWTVF